MEGPTKEEVRATPTEPKPESEHQKSCSNYGGVIREATSNSTAALKHQTHSDGMTLRQLAEIKNHPNSMLAHRMLESHMAKFAITAMIMEYYELGMQAKNPKNPYTAENHSKPGESNTCDAIYGIESATKRR